MVDKEEKRYEVRLKRSVEKTCAKLPDKAKKRIAARLRDLEENPLRRISMYSSLYRKQKIRGT